ncbi:MAG: 5'/3'-nucleotidase SurE [Gemmataceae bacterium]|nr:5'/3'-nucleotidase SurE [Gemmataceae bacterium]
MRILLTNDDGVYAPGLRALRKELQKLGDVTVVAPVGEQSAVGHSITLLTPLLVQEVLDEQNQPMGWAVEGRPADCVKLALLELLRDPPDLIVSGLNAGSNAGINVLYSGTVAAAVEGSFFHCTSVAVSLEYTKPKPLDFPRAAGLARRVIEQILDQRPPGGSLFNVNIPSFDKGSIRGIRSASQNIAPYRETFDRRIDPRGRVYFWSNPDFSCPSPHPDTDVTALGEGYVTVTPLQFNLTHAVLLEQMKGWAWRLDGAEREPPT